MSGACPLTSSRYVMYSLFQYDPKITYGTVHLSEWTYVKDGLQRNLLTLLNHYRHASYAVAAEHLLVQLIQSCVVPLSLSVDRFYANIHPISLTLASPFRLTSPVSVGKIFDGVFYGKGNAEVIIATDVWFDPATVVSSWENATPVRVLRHPFTDLELGIPNGKVQSQEKGLAVITVNVAELIVQYYGFYHAERAKQQIDPTYVPRTIMQFVHMFVLPNMLASHLDYALFNRIQHLQQNLPFGKPLVRHPFVLTDYRRQVTSLQMRMLDILKRSGYSFDATLGFIPTVDHETLEKTLVLPDITPTRQVLWALVVARLPALRFLIATAEYGTKMRDQREVDAIGETLAIMKRQRVFEAALPDVLYASVMSNINEIIEKTRFTQFS